MISNVSRDEGIRSYLTSDRVLNMVLYILRVRRQSCIDMFGGNRRQIDESAEFTRKVPSGGLPRSPTCDGKDIHECQGRSDQCRSPRPCGCDLQIGLLENGQSSHVAKPTNGRIDMKKL